MKRAFVYRGPRSFYFARKRYPLDSLKSRMAEHRTCLPGGGGHWYGGSGDGEAYANDMNRFGKWRRVRTIKGGQWAGPWRYELID